MARALAGDPQDALLTVRALDPQSRANLMIQAEGLYGAALKAKVEEVLVQSPMCSADRLRLENADRMTHPTRGTKMYWDVLSLTTKHEEVVTSEKRRRLETAEGTGVRRARGA